MCVSAYQRIFSLLHALLKWGTSDAKESHIFSSYTIQPNSTTIIASHTLAISPISYAYLKTAYIAYTQTHTTATAAAEDFYLAFGFDLEFGSEVRCERQYITYISFIARLQANQSRVE